MKKIILLIVILSSLGLVSQNPSMTRDALYYTTQQINDPNTTGGNIYAFGQKVKVFGNTMLVSAYQNNIVYIYEKANSIWVLNQTLTPSFFSDGFGHSFDLSINENLLVIQSNSHVFIFEKQGGLWQEVYQSSVNGGSSPGQGNSVAISEPFFDTGVRIAVGACNYNFFRGAVSILRPTGGSWIEDVDNVLLNDLGQPFDKYGESLAWSGQTLFVGVRGANNFSGSVGQIAIGTNGPANVLPNIPAPNSQVDDEFGFNLIANENKLIVASKGKVFIYNIGSISPSQELTPETSDIPNYFGQSLSFTSSGFAVSSFNNTHNSVYVYSSTGNNNSSLLDIISLSDYGTAPIAPSLNSLGMTRFFGTDGDNINWVVQYLENGEIKRSILKLNRAQNLTQTDLNRLSSFYSATDGNNWFNNSNWTTNLQPRRWHGLRTDVVNGAEEITEILLANNNLDGQIPSSFDLFNEITTLDIKGNSLFGNLPDLSNNSNLQSVAIQNNNYQFEDINLVLSDYQQIIQNNFTYSPQLTTDTAQNIISAVGSNISISVAQYEENVQSSDRDFQNSNQNNQFQWFKDNAVISGANSPTYDIINAQESDSGIYNCEITNPIIPNLTILSAPVALTIDPDLGILDNEKLDLLIYPNPVFNWINIKLGNSIDNGRLSIHDLYGKIINQLDISGDTYILNVENISSGVYIITLEHNETIHKQKFIKE